MSQFPEQKVRIFLRETMNDLLGKLDEVTEGVHPLWDKRFSNVMAEVVLQTIKAGNLGEIELGE